VRKLASPVGYHRSRVEQHKGVWCLGTKEVTVVDELTDRAVLLVDVTMGADLATGS
jgi:hypothetical protein